MIRGFSTHLLGRHITGSAHHHPRLGTEWLSGLKARGIFCWTQPGQTKIEDLHPSIFGEKEVFRLQVTVNDTSVMRGGQSVRDLYRLLDGLAQRDRPAPQPLAQRLALQQLLHQIRHVAMRVHFKNGENVGMV